MLLHGVYIDFARLSPDLSQVVCLTTLDNSHWVIPLVRRNIPIIFQGDYYHGRTSYMN